MNTHFKITAVAILLTFANTAAFGQYQETYPVPHCKDGQCRIPSAAGGDNAAGIGGFVRDRYQDEMDRLLNGYDRRAPLENVVEDRYRTPINDDDYRESRYGVDSNTRRVTPDRYRPDNRSLPAWNGYSDDSRNRGSVDQNFRGRTENPFRIDQRRWENTSDRYQANPYRREISDNLSGLTPNNTDYNFRQRDRMPLSPVDYRNPFGGRNDQLQDPFGPLEDAGGSNRQIENLDDRIQDLPAPPSTRPNFDRAGTDPFAPPLPRREGNEEAESIFQAITVRGDVCRFELTLHDTGSEPEWQTSIESLAV